MKRDKMPLRIWLNLIPAICYSLFVYHFVSVTHDYLQYKTITKVEYHSDSDVPLLTIGFNTPVPIVELYSKAFPNKTYPYEKAGDDVSWKNSSLGKHCGEAYEAMYTNDTWHEMNWQRMSYRELWDCYLYYFGDKRIREYLQELPQRFGQFVDYWSDDFTTGLARLDYYENVSFSVGTGGNIEMTLLANLPSNIRFRKGTRFNVEYDYAGILPFNEWEHYVQLHSATAVPHYHDSHFLDTKCDQSLYYHSVAIHRLPPPYDTHCYNYEATPLKGTISESDCIATCVFRHFLQTIPSGTTFNSYFDFWNYFIKAQLFPDQTTMSQIMKDRLANKNLRKKDFQMAESFCNRNCPTACEKMQYNWILLPDPRLPKYCDMFIVLKHQFEKDQLYSHQAAFDWLTYLCNVGGLAGMWIGISFKSVCTGLLALPNKRLCTKNLKGFLSRNITRIWRFLRRKRQRRKDRAQVPIILRPHITCNNLHLHKNTYVSR